MKSTRITAFPLPASTITRVFVLIGVRLCWRMHLMCACEEPLHVFSHGLKVQYTAHMSACVVATFSIYISEISIV